MQLGFYKDVQGINRWYWDLKCNSFEHYVLDNKNQLLLSTNTTNTLQVLGVWVLGKLLEILPGLSKSI